LRLQQGQQPGPQAAQTLFLHVVCTNLSLPGSHEQLLNEPFLLVLRLQVVMVSLKGNKQTNQEGSVQRARPPWLSG
jgi:hypothetical protein